MNPSIWLYGGIHHDPGSRQRFLKELAKQETAPHFVAVEWEQSVFERLAAWRHWIAEGLKYRWDFLTHEDCYELSLTLAWEGDAYAECFPGTEVLWLESGFQSARLQQRNSDVNTSAKGDACDLLQRLYGKSFQFPLLPPPELRSKAELIDHVWRTLWAEEKEESQDFERDARWADAICERSASLCDGWIAVVVGWAHAKPVPGNRRLQDLLSSRSFPINPVCLGPLPGC